MKILDVEQGTDAWRAARAGIATASCFNAVLATIKSGEAATRRNYRSRLVVERLTSKCIENGFETFATKQGHEREPMAREAYMVKTGCVVEQVGFCLDDSGLWGCSPDGLVGEAGGVEIKCPDIAAHLDYLLREDEPPEYRPQIQGNLMGTGRKWWDFVSWNPDFPEHLQLVIRRVLPDPKYIAGLRLAVKIFMDEVLTDEAVLRALPQAAEYEAA